LRISLLLVCIAFALPCGATQLLADLLACRSITDSAARLACFDRETAALAAAPAASLAVPAPPQIAATPPAAEQPVPALDAQQSFGLSGSAVAAKDETAGGRPVKLAKIESRVVGLSLTGNGRTVFTLENSQMWRQLESDGDILARLGDVATISRGLLGSFWLQLKSGRGCKVTRLR
jgi:hypothetical protein